MLFYGHIIVCPKTARLTRGGNPDNFYPTILSIYEALYKTFLLQADNQSGHCRLRDMQNTLQFF